MGTSSKSKQTQQQTQTSTPTFESPEAKQMLSSLTGSYSANQGALGGAQSDSAAYLKSLMGTTNPHTESVISAMEAQAPRQYSKNLAQIRTAGYRGGAGSDYINQAGLASDFANQLALNTANTRLNQFNQDRGTSLTAANSLGSLGTSNQALGLSLLDALRGSKTTGETSGSAKGSTIDYGKIAAGTGTALLKAIAFL